MLKEKINKNILDIVSTIGLPVCAGVFFVVWIVNLLKHPVINFPLIAIPIIALYYFSGNIYSGILTFITIITGILDIAFFIGHKSEAQLVFFECIAIMCLYLILEMYKDKHIAIKNGFFEEYDTLNMEIILKESATLENKKRTNNLLRQAENFRKISNILQSFQASLNEKETIHKCEDIVYNFIGKGSWKLKKYKESDVFSFYVKNTTLPLMIANMSEDRRFPSERDNNKLSLIAVPVELNSVFWGTLQGTSYLKDFFSEEDLRQLSLLLGTISAILNNFYSYKKLQILAITDGVTGLYTHAYFSERLKEELNRLQNNNVSLSLAILDMDFFKSVNDQYGHLAGDSLLRQIATLLCSKFRKTDFIARYGGDEFAFMMPHTNSKEASKVLEKIRLVIEKERFFLTIGSLSPVRIKTTGSIGFVSLSKKNPISEEDIIKRADVALYKAKQSGRNRVAEYSDE
jgi:diguanylate cyclase (GGDEF)-like protein